MVVGTQSQYAEDLNQLSRKNGQRDEELSDILSSYRICLQSMDMDDAVRYVQNVDFHLAAQVLNSSVVVYGRKVDNLEETTETLLLEMFSSKTKSSNRNANNLDDGAPDITDECPDIPVLNKRRQRRVRDCVDEDDFFEIDNHLKNNKGLHMSNEESCVTFLDFKLSHCAKSDNNKKRVDVRLKKIDDKDKSRLRDWFLNDDYMVVRETFMEEVMSDELRYAAAAAVVAPDAGIVSVIPVNADDDDDENNDAREEMSVNGAMSPRPTDVEPLEDLQDSMSEASFKLPCHRYRLQEFMQTSAKDKMKNQPLKPGTTVRLPCPECNTRKKPHKAGGKICQQLKKRPLPALDVYFKPHVEPRVGQALLGPLHNRELVSAYVEHLKQVKLLKKQHEIDFSDARVADPGFIGFDDDSMDDMERGHDDSMDLGLPCPGDDDFDLPNPASILPSLQDPTLVPTDGGENEILASQNAETTKDMILRISRWHESLRSKIFRAEERGVLNMDLLAGKIFETFPKEDPKVSFQGLVREADRSDVARYFLTCLQLANEENILIEPAEREDSMMLTRLRETRLKQLDEYNPDEQLSATQGVKRKKTLNTNRKRRPAATDR